MKILFLCVANSARSQLAEGLARKFFGDRHEFFSAGSSPSKINPLAVKVLQEAAIDTSGQFSKSTDDIDLQSIDLIITLCAEEVCPVVTAKVKKLHWPFKDPGTAGTEDEKLESFRRIRDIISAKLQELESLPNWS
jgi:arsenate reductase